MKKCILYGIGGAFERRRWIENFIDENEYEIIGYSDGRYKEDYIDHKVFYCPERISELDYDYLIINAEYSLETIRKSLISENIPVSKMIIPVLYKAEMLNDGYSNYNITADMSYESANSKGRVILFGASEAIRGINTEILETRYVFAGGARDLYFNYKGYLYSIEKNLFEGIKDAVFVLPYWIFGYDMSADINQYRGHTMFMEGYAYGDYHSASKLGNLEINNSILNYKMFGRKLYEYYRWTRRMPISNEIFMIESLADIDFGSIWNRRKNVEKENIEILSLHIGKLLENGVQRIYIIVPPYYYDYLPDEVKKEGDNKVNKSKEVFYDCLEKVLENRRDRVKILDCFDLFDHRVFFKDIYHLNSYGAEKFSQHVIRLMNED